ncbi:UDP-N-acetylmuramoyl-tripeptide--D-alanyl-D-alanine ligase [Actinomyces howellii]|uniref:UDP-N-acetylmuramoyl-tripeptide--D-alanyl-D-alanine ligase n=2 Tax=Actinomyces howellii TaxID=52771 RepID=A0A448HF31_9ACTO|nr:UDP-N-acetylmuramoyl-tripeptide--D-alanyl-D-alanine ligase [Actinomyces howellii]VEG26850.1 UDP-N-acetylmuramoyl-tripeptide--D-alanyl-D-alanine ligase [Actinomyces howellii]
MIPRSLPEVADMVGAAPIEHAAASVQAGPAAAPAITSVVTDSRQAGPGCLFVAIAGQRTDGHDHIAQVARAGGGAALVSDPQAARASLERDGGGQDLPLLVVPGTVEALGALARAHLVDLRARASRRGAGLTVVAMTGSVGKTTTKDLTRQLLAAQGPTVAPVASFNNEIGLPMTVLGTEESTRYLVLEMGASGPGHIDYLTAIAPLDAAAVLMVGHAHMGGFGSVEGVAAAKAEILRGLEPTGTAVLNRDDPRALAMAGLAPAEVLTFSAAGDPEADLRATGVELGEGARASFDLHLPGLPAPERVTLALPGAHNVSNALAALGLALAAGADPQGLVASLAQARIESPHRMDIGTVERPAGQVLLIDDSYNANIDSMTAALRSLPVVAGTRRSVVVISEMLELGESSRGDHALAGRTAGEVGADLVVGIGAGTGPALEEASRAGARTVLMTDAQEAVASIDALLLDGDAVLVKGSLGSGAWRVADHLKEATDR